MRKALPAFIAAFFLALSPACAEPSDVAAGEALYKTKCALCHALDKNKIGPKLHGVFGRPSASVTDFKGYSSGLKSLNKPWDETTLDLWLADPVAMTKTNKMTTKIASPEERAKIIAYLKTLK